MPMAMDPNTRHRVVLACDKDKKPAPTFVYPFLTGRQQAAMLQVYDDIGDGNVQGENIKKAFNLAAMFLCDWENMTHPETGEPMPFDPKRLDELCSVQEAMELGQNVMFGQVPEVLDKKKLDFPSASDTARSASPVAE